MKKIRVIDSHTGGEPTRLVIDGAPDLGKGPLSHRVQVFRDRYDSFRKSVILEPRGSDVHVGALLCDPVDSTCSAGVIFFNNTGYLNMCGHGMIGLVVSLAYLGRLKHGVHRIETPVGIVEIQLLNDHAVQIKNVASYRYQSRVGLQVPGYGIVQGDIAWGGNWFFLTDCPQLTFDANHLTELLRLSSAIRKALNDQGVTGADGGEIDHIELYRNASESSGSAETQGAVNFVLCPGGAWDRSPCGTGTSAKLACLAADGKLQPGQEWHQQSVIGSLFSGTFELKQGDDCGGEGAPVIIPSITGSAWVSGDATLLVSESDPFAAGIPITCPLPDTH